MGNGATASKAGGVAIGAGAQATADPATALGNNAVASGNNSVALGANSTASASNSVALGAGSVANQANTVSVGTATNQRRITDVAAGTADTDAVNVGQLNSGLASTLSQANSYTDNKITGLRKAMSSRADGGTAAALAVAGIPQASGAGKFMVGVGFGNWRSASGVAVGGSALLNDGHTAIKAGATFDTHGGDGFSAGIGYQF
jgi:autotransporter adhesin